MIVNVNKLFFCLFIKKNDELILKLIHQTNMATEIVCSLKKCYCDEVHSGDTNWWLNNLIEYCDNYNTDIDTIVKKVNQYGTYDAMVLYKKYRGTNHSGMMDINQYYKPLYSVILQEEIIENYADELSEYTGEE